MDSWVNVLGSNAEEAAGLEAPSAAASSSRSGGSSSSSASAPGQQAAVLRPLTDGDWLAPGTKQSNSVEAANAQTAQLEAEPHARCDGGAATTEVRRPDSFASVQSPSATLRLSRPLQLGTVQQQQQPSLQQAMLPQQQVVQQQPTQQQPGIALPPQAMVMQQLFQCMQQQQQPMAGLRDQSGDANAATAAAAAPGISVNSGTDAHATAVMAATPSQPALPSQTAARSPPSPAGLPEVHATRQVQAFPHVAPAGHLGAHSSSSTSVAAGPTAWPGEVYSPAIGQPLLPAVLKTYPGGTAMGVSAASLTPDVPWGQQSFPAAAPAAAAWSAGPAAALPAAIPTMPPSLAAAGAAAGGPIATAAPAMTMTEASGVFVRHDELDVLLVASLRKPGSRVAAVVRDLIEEALEERAVAEKRTLQRLEREQQAQLRELECEVNALQARLRQVLDLEEAEINAGVWHSSFPCQQYTKYTRQQSYPHHGRHATDANYDWQSSSSPAGASGSGSVNGSCSRGAGSGASGSSGSGSRGMHCDGGGILAGSSGSGGGGAAGARHACPFECGRYFTFLDELEVHVLTDHSEGAADAHHSGEYSSGNFNHGGCSSGGALRIGGNNFGGSSSGGGSNAHGGSGRSPVQLTLNVQVGGTRHVVKVPTNPSLGEVRAAISHAAGFPAGSAPSCLIVAGRLISSDTASEPDSLPFRSKLPPAQQDDLEVAVLAKPPLGVAAAAGGGSVSVGGSGAGGSGNGGSMGGTGGAGAVGVGVLRYAGGGGAAA